MLLVDELRREPPSTIITDATEAEYERTKAAKWPL